MRKKSLSWLLVIAMVLSMLISAPITASVVDLPGAVFSDGDIDRVYFSGDTLTFNLSGLPVGTPPAGIPAGTSLRVSLGIVDASNTFTDFTLFNTSTLASDDSNYVFNGMGDNTGWYLSRTLNADGTLSSDVSGTIVTTPPPTLGVAAVKIYVYTGSAWQNFMDDGNPTTPDFIPLTADGKNAIVGLDGILEMPDGVTSDPVIGTLAQTAEDLRSLDISFTKTIALDTTGTIAFTGLNLLDNSSGLADLDDGLIMDQVSIPAVGAIAQYTLGVDVDTLTFLETVGATVSVTSTSFDGYETSDFEAVAADVTGGLVSGLSFDDATDTVSFTVNHFSNYTLSLLENEPELYDAVINVVDGTGTGTGWTFDPAGEIWLNENGSYLINGGGIQTSNRIRVKTGVIASVTLDNVNIVVHLPFEVGGTANATIILKDGNNNTFTSSAGHAGIRVQPSATLTITSTGQPLGNGMLTAIGSSDSRSHWATAGIGGSELEPSGTIIIDGGIITARGGNGSSGGAGAPGIGGAAYRACGNITINGGTITAIGGSTGFGGAGIGGGSSDPLNTGGEITINGGTVKAYSGIAGDSGPAIGYCNTIAINNSAYIEAYSSGTVLAIAGTTAVSGHNAYLLNFMLDSSAVADTSLNITNTIDDSDSITLNLKKDYKNFAVIVSGANTYQSESVDGSKYVANVSDDSRDFIGVLTAPFTSIGSISAKLVGVPPTASNVAISGSAIVGETLSGEYDFNGTSESGSTYRWLADTGSQSEVFNTGNIAGVDNNPTVPAEFVLSEPTLISKIENYHWNYGSGAAPGTIALQEAGGTLYGPWDATGIAGNLYWLVQPYVVLPAGTYTIIDSSNETWANNSESGYRGMSIVYTADYINDYTPIDGATDQSYVLTSGDLGKMIKFEVTVRDSSGLTGSAMESSPVGPVNIPTPEPGTIQFEAGGYGTYEGYNGWIRVERIDGSDGTVSVDYSTADDTAIAGIHYTAVNGTLTWNDGDNDVKVVPITIANDSQYNGYLYLTYILSNPTGGAKLGSRNPLTVQVSDNDNPPTPTGLTATAGNGQVTLEWDEVNYAYYKLYYSTTLDSFTEGNSVAIYDGTSHTMTGLTNGTTYYFAVKAGHNIYFSELTDAISATPKSPSSGGSSYTPPAIIVVTEENNGSTTNSTEVPFSTVSGTASAAVTTAIVDALLDKVDSDGGSEKNDLIELEIDTKAGIDELKISILQKDLEELIEETDASLGLTSPFISITFDARALETISAADSGGTVVISAGIVDNSSISEADQAKVKDRPVYDLTVMNGDTQVSNFKGGHATVSIPYTLRPDENPNAIVIYYLADDGTLKTVRGHYDAELKSVVFKTSHFSHFVIGYNSVTFTDVKDTAWYKDAIDFIAARGITSGIGENNFGPENKLTRAQFVVLLMNAYQINTQNQGDSSQIQNFSDAGNTYYTDYLMAAKTLGIVNGVGNNLFAPEKEITRQEMFVMLHNALKVIDEVPAATVNKELSGFNDANQVADWANEALSNLVTAGIVSGSNNELNPTSTTTRAEIAQVLYNLLSNKN